MGLLEKIKSNILFFDGGYGSQLVELGLKPGEQPELWNLSHKEEVISLHRRYALSGADIIKTNTFGANSLKIKNGLEKVIFAAVSNAKAAAPDKLIALDIGPTGKMLEPIGELSFEKAVCIFAEVVKIGKSAGVDLILIETFTDLYETKAAVIAAKENCDLPIFVTNAYTLDGCLLTGASPEVVAITLEALGVAAIGVNCSFGPNDSLKIVRQLAKHTSLPIIASPNAGLPTSINGKICYDVSSSEFAESMQKIAESGATILGGCCGTSPEYIKKLTSLASALPFVKRENKGLAVVTSQSKAVYLGLSPLIIGERINPTGKPAFKAALVAGDRTYALKEAIKQQKAGADILDVNVGHPDIDEEAVLCETVKSLQTVVDLPLQIDTSSYKALEKAMRIYNGIPLVNSVCAKESSMKAVFPLIKKYGGVVVCLTLDENGIPSTAEGRLDIAKKIILEAEKYQIPPYRLIFDTLTMAVSASTSAAEITLNSLSKIKTELKANTILGVSNVSFGLPNRAMLNASFLSMAILKGLDAAILNPFSADIMKAFYASCALCGKDNLFASYISHAEEYIEGTINRQKREDSIDIQGLKGAIIKGLSEEAKLEAEKLLSAGEKQLDIIEQHIIPALNEVGKAFENKTLFLPGLLISAEAAKAAFSVVKSKGEKAVKPIGKIVLATVKGDIHDIGKNIVKLLLESHGFEVIDLGRDVDKTEVLAATIKNKVSLVGLSALMTTTVPQMAETIELLRANTNCKIMVGGAVLTEETAKRIGADFYAADAAASVKYAETIFNVK